MKRLGTAIVVGILFGLASLRVNADLCNNIPRNLTPKTVNQINHCVATAHSTQSKYLNPYTKQYIKVRRQLHEKIINKTFASVPCRAKPIALFSGGVMGAGKTTALEKYFPIALKQHQFVVISTDDIREELPDYSGWNASLTQAETKDVVAMMFDRLLADRSCRRNVLLD